VSASTLTSRVLLSTLIAGAATAPSTAWSASITPATTATIAPSLSPDRLGSRATLTYTIHYAGGALGVPLAVHHATLEFPAGMTLELPSLHTCARNRLLADGPGACPARSHLGSGQALAEVLAGSQILTENLRMWALLGPPRNLQPTVEILVQGYTPFDERVLLTATPFTESPPYGEGLQIPIPAIPTLALEPSASIVSFTLTIGARTGRGTGRVVIPSNCPTGGFPFAADFTYSDGSTGDAFARASCPA
jgi:hypothetical protein